MKAHCITLPEEVEAIVGPRLTAFLEPYSAKDLARIFQVSVSTCEKWRCGHLPSTKHLGAMISFWGQTFIDGVFCDLLHEPVTVAARAERIEQDMKILKRELANVRTVLDLAGGVTETRGDLGGFAGSRPCGAETPVSETLAAAEV